MVPGNRRGVLVGDEGDAGLVARSLAGEQDAFELLVRRHTRLVHGIALAHLGNTMDAEDVAQEVFIKAHAVLSTCRDPDRFASWVARITQRKSINARMARMVRRTLGLGEARSVAAARVDAAVADDRRASLARALERLSSVRREVVVLHDVHGFSHAEIASRISCSEVMSRRHLADGRKQLREWLNVHRPEG